MRRTRFLLPVVFVVGMLAWPAVSTAAGGLGGPGGVPLASQAVPNLSMPPAVPGATIGIATMNDAHAFHGAATMNLTSGVYYASDPGSGSDVWVTLDMPVGSIVARIDAYSYRVASGSNDWDVWSWDGVNGVSGTMANVSSPTGAGVIQTTITSFASNTVYIAHEWNVDMRLTAAGSSGLVGVVYQYFPPTFTLTPISPVRVYDSRFDAAGKLLNGQKRTVNVKNAINPANGAVTVANAIPLGAKAISFTVTLTGTAGSGNVAVLPASAAPVVTASTINWTTANLDIATGSMVTMGVGAFERQVCLALGGSATAASHVIIDVTGYYM